jgi:hypothetical protein
VRVALAGGATLDDEGTLRIALLDDAATLLDEERELLDEGVVTVRCKPMRVKPLAEVLDDDSTLLEDEDDALLLCSFRNNLFNSWIFEAEDEDAVMLDRRSFLTDALVPTDELDAVVDLDVRKSPADPLTSRVTTGILRGSCGAKSLTTVGRRLFFSLSFFASMFSVCRGTCIGMGADDNCTEDGGLGRN